MTIGAESPFILNTCILLVSGIFAIVLPRSSTDYLPSSRPSSPQPASKSPTLQNGRKQTEVKDRLETTTQVSALTTYRSHMLLMTFLAILAVDFPIFPRNLAKCETFGMDIGVGSFVFSQGIISAKAFVKNPSYLASPILPKIQNATGRVFPIILLGIIRVILVKGSDYPEHVSEYGVHWNFFLSMAVLPIFEIILHPLIYRFHFAIIGLAVTLIHQLVLSKTSLQRWALDAPRDNIVSQNKEGIVSLPGKRLGVVSRLGRKLLVGYLAIHMLGLLIGTVVLPPSPSDFKRLKEQSKKINSSKIPYKEQPRQDSKTAVELCSYAIVWWFLLLSANAINIGQGVSRRLPTPHLEKEHTNINHVRYLSKANCDAQDNDDKRGKEGRDQLNGDQDFELNIYLYRMNSRLIASSLPWKNPTISFRSAPPDDSFSPHVEVEWSDSTDLGDFIKSVVSTEHFRVVINSSEPKVDTKEEPGSLKQESGPIDNATYEKPGPPNPQDIIITVQVPSFQDRTQFLRRRLTSIDIALSHMETLKQECDREAQRGARRLAMSGFGREVSYTSVLSQSVSARRLALYKAKGFNLERWADLIAERKTLRREMNRIAEDYDIQWDGRWEDDLTEGFDTKNEEKEQIKEETIQPDMHPHRDMGAIRIKGDNDDYDKLEVLDKKAGR
ncbi:hypothetical protein Clacol_010595 [Clathrus columnatus]|uniref:GPI-anchored wall transfer protein 1 n=1 Tax=Clathrus columnatus TaxID=1419009 RepID=A0AAV5ATG5_9AGAM|nr:hypothetical protein Clacol_010595 [Clathrus columnatus]